jgi:predicted MFS family arabinose efflux permease
VGPAVGGLLAGVSYLLLFSVDGITCIAAGILFFLYFRNRRGHRAETPSGAATEEKVDSPYRDYPFLVFTLLSSIFAILFFQFIFTLPLFYREVYELPEIHIGALLALNGLVVFLLEMILVYKIGNKVSAGKLIFIGMAMMGFSFSLLNLGFGMHFLMAAMIILSVSEILVMPYLATVSVQRSGLSNRGKYMSLYTLSYSIGFVLAPLLGTTVVEHYGFYVLWWLVGVFSIITAIGFYLTLNWMRRG